MTEQRVLSRPMILREYFGPGNNSDGSPKKTIDFMKEIKELKEDPETYNWICQEAAKELGVKVKQS